MASSYYLGQKDLHYYVAKDSFIKESYLINDESVVDHTSLVTGCSFLTPCANTISYAEAAYHDAR